MLVYVYLHSFRLFARIWRTYSGFKTSAQLTYLAHSIFCTSIRSIGEDIDDGTLR